MQPHEAVDPFFSDVARTVAIFPQSHRHIHRVYALPFGLWPLGAALITVRRLNRLPDRFSFGPPALFAIVAGGGLFGCTSGSAANSPERDRVDVFLLIHPLYNLSG